MIFQQAMLDCWRVSMESIGFILKSKFSQEHMIEYGG